MIHLLILIDVQLKMNTYQHENNSTKAYLNYNEKEGNILQIDNVLILVNEFSITEK